MTGWWVFRIRNDAEQRGSASLGDYFDELLTDDERLEKSMDWLGDRIEAAIGGEC